MKNRTVEIKWAFIFIIMMLIWMYGEKMAGLHDEHIDQHPIYTNLVALPAIIIYVLALLDRRRKTAGNRFTYKQGFVSGLIITIIVTVFTPLTQYITSEIITPDYFDNVIAYSVENNIMDEETAIDQFNLQNYIIQSTIGSFVMGVITTAIVAIFTRRKA